MIEKIVNIYNLDDPHQQKRDLAFWLTKTTDERISAVELLRRQQHGSTVRLQRVAKVVQRPSS